MSRKGCKWCTAAPTTREFFNEYCSEQCFHTHDADPCCLCNINPGRVLGDLGCFYCTDCCRKRLLEVKENCEKIKYRENQLVSE